MFYVVVNKAFSNDQDAWIYLHQHWIGFNEEYLRLCYKFEANVSSVVDILKININKPFF